MLKQRCGGLCERASVCVCARPRPTDLVWAEASAGTLVAVEVVITLAAELFLWADCRGADSAFVGILATLLMPMLLPSLALAAYSAVICFATAGFALGAVTAALGTPLLLLHALRVRSQSRSRVRLEGHPLQLP